MKRFRRPSWRIDWHLFGLVFLLVFLLGVGLWLAFAAPCDAIDWMPARELPGRCFR